MTGIDEESAPPNDHYNADETIQSNGISKHFKSELHKTYFSLQEPTGNSIDIANTFAPASPRFHHVLVLRVLLLVWSIISLVFSLRDWGEPNRFIYLGYLTHLGFVIAIVYQITACIVTVHRKSLTQPLTKNADEMSQYNGPSKLVKTMWFLYSLSAPNEILITILYWALDYPTKGGVPKYSSVYVHGILAVLLLIDGNLIARIPIRIKHFITFEIYCVLYLTWSLIHALSGVGNGDKDGDLLYNVIDWKDKPISTLITVVLLLLIATPMIFMLVWLLSLVGGCVSFNGERRQIHKG